MTKSLYPILASAFVVFALAGCSATPPSGGDSSNDDLTASSAQPNDADTETAGEADEEGTDPAAVAPDGCTLVSADLVRQYLGVEPGTCEPITSWADGPAGLYSTITMAIDTTASAPMYMPREVCGGGGIDGALPVPGADYGYAVEGELCIIKGSIGVKTSALLDGGVTTAENWQQLAVALLERI